MFEKLKNLRVNLTAGALLCIVLGIVCIIWPTEIVKIAVLLIGIVFIIAGIAEFISGAVGDIKKPVSIGLGVLLLIVGIWVVANKMSAAKIFPIMIGIILIVSACEDFSLSAAGKNASAPNWQGIILSGAIKLVLGIIAITFAFKVVKYATVISGIFLLIDGVASIFTVHKVNRAEGVFDSTIKSERDL